MEIVHTPIADEIDRIAEELERLGRKGLPWYGSQYEIDHLRQASMEIRRLKKGIADSEQAGAGKSTIEVYFDWNAMCLGTHGCYRARLKSDHRIEGAGVTQIRAFLDCKLTAESLGRPGPFEIANGEDR